MYTRRPRHSLPGPDDTQRRTLSNGITLLVRENFASPAVVVNGYLEAGAEDELQLGGEGTPPYGLADFTVEVMERGTHNRSFDELYEAVESVGAAFGLSSGTHITGFGGKGLAEYLPLLLEIINDVLRAPSFPESHVEKARAEQLSDFQERRHSTRRMASLIFKELAYPKEHPYHSSLSGYPETIEPLTRDALVDFHERFFSPEGMVVVVVGAVKAPEVVETVEKVFGNWSGSRPTRPPLPEVPTISERREQRVVIEDKSQSNVVLGWPGPARKEPDFIPAYVANTILGVFGMYGRLGKNVREEHGLAYYVYSRISGGQGPGPWQVVAGVDPSNVDQTVELIRQEIRRIREDLVTKDELEDVKSYLAGSLPLHLETNEGVAQTLANMERHDLGLDYLLNYREMIGKVNAFQVREAAQRWLDPDNFALSIAGPEVEG